jgi:hypothetical protein
VRAPDRASARLRKHRIEGDGDTEPVQYFDDLLRAEPARTPEGCERIGDSIDPAEMQSQQVGLALVLECAQLHAGDDVDPVSFSRGAGILDAVNRVVVGERDGGQTSARRRLDELRRGDRTVGRRRVHVQVDEAWRGRTRRHRHGV